MTFFTFVFMAEWQAVQNAVFDLDWVPGEHRLVSGHAEGSGAHHCSAITWDAQTQKILATFEGHTGSVKTINCVPNDKSEYKLLW